MNIPLLQGLLDSPTPGQMAGGVMMILLFSFVGFVVATATAFVARRVFLGWHERAFWAGFLVAVAAFYMGFAAWFQVSPAAWQTELIAIVLFVLVAVAGAFSSMALAIGYALHGVWDIAHSLYGTVILGHPASDIPLGYGMFCLGFDFAAAAYLLGWPQQANQPARFQPRFWRNLSGASAHV